MVNKKNDFNTINLIQTLMKPLFMFIILFIFAHSSVYASDDSQKLRRQQDMFFLKRLYQQYHLHLVNGLLLEYHIQV